MFVGSGVLVGVVVQGVRRQRVGVRPQVVGRAGSATCERDGVEAPRDRKGRTENAGHQLMSRVCVYGCAAGVPLVVPPAVLCGRVKKET